MTLDEAIKHAEEVASRKFDDNVHCIKCAEEHRQLAEWLKDYKRLLAHETILDKIREEISKAWCTQPKNRYEEGLKDQALKDMKIIDKYRKAESEEDTNGI